MLNRSLTATLCLSLAFAATAEAKDKKLSDKKIERIIVSAAKKAEVPAHLMLAICWIESNYHQNLPEVNDGMTPSYGICQVKLETASHMDEVYKHRNKVSVEKLRDPYVNAFYAAKYIKYQLKRYGGDWKKAAAAYNQGSFSEQRTNRKYVRKIEIAMKERNLSSVNLFEAK